MCQLLVNITNDGRTGRPCVKISSDTVIFLRSLNFTWVSIAQLLNVTLYRRCKEMGLGSDADDNRITYNDLLPVVIDIKKDFSDLGERLLLGILLVEVFHVHGRQ